ncbi:MAG: lipoate--protein ligase family protein [Hyphomicrobiaceae bacterium]|nr:hypothetical protein [Hyphomicrobiaceae bacterium]MCC0008052.1 lipoate--protein ligase family protein [Hyphomicrobiaceae bacterium]
MSLEFRVIDTGLRDGRANIAYDAALIELHSEGTIPDTLRFLQFRPTALVGRHQAASRELKLERCHADGVAIGRRITGGGAIYFDEGMLGWELVLSRKRLLMPSLADYTRTICESAAAGLSRAFGIDARFRPRNDIEVAGRKLSGTGGFFDGDTLFFQGTLLIDADPAAVMSYLNVPRAKIERHDIDRPEARITTLSALLGGVPELGDLHRAIAEGLAQGLDLQLVAGEPSQAEEQRAQMLLDTEIGTDAFVYDIDAPADDAHGEGSTTGPGGTVTAFVRIDGAGDSRRIRDILFTGDFFLTPPRLVLDLEAALRGREADLAGAAVEDFFASAHTDLFSISPADFRSALEMALARV